MRCLTLFAALLAIASPAGGRDVLLVGNKGEDTLSIIDLSDGRERARLATGRMPHEIAISPDGRQAAVVAYGGRTIDVFDIAGGAKVRTIDLSPNEGPHGLAWLRDGRLVATTERSKSVAIVDPANKDSVRSIATGQTGTHMIAVSPDGRRAFTANIPAGTVTALDLAAGTKIGDIAVGGEPEGITLSRDGRILWVADLKGARVQAFDVSGSLAKPRRLAEIGVGNRPIRVIASPDGRWIVTSDFADGTLTVIDARSRRVSRTIKVSGDANAGQVTIIFSPDGKRIYAAETGRNQVAEIDFASGRVLRRLAAGRQGDGLAFATVRD